MLTQDAIDALDIGSKIYAVTVKPIDVFDTTDYVTIIHELVQISDRGDNFNYAFWSGNSVEGKSGVVIVRQRELKEPTSYFATSEEAEAHGKALKAAKLKELREMYDDYERYCHCDCRGT